MLLKDINDKIIVFSDGPRIEEIETDLPLKIDGYTFNPIYLGKIMLKIIYLIQKKF